MQVYSLALSLFVLLQDASEHMQNGTGGPDDAPGKVSTTEPSLQNCLLSYVDADSLLSHKICIYLRGLTPYLQNEIAGILTVAGILTCGDQRGG